MNRFLSMALCFSPIHVFTMSSKGLPCAKYSSRTVFGIWNSFQALQLLEHKELWICLIAQAIAPSHSQNLYNIQKHDAFLTTLVLFGGVCILCLLTGYLSIDVSQKLDMGKRVLVALSSSRNPEQHQQKLCDNRWLYNEQYCLRFPLQASDTEP